MSAPAERVFSAWLSPVDHVRYWCEHSEQLPTGYRLQFIDGTIEHCALEESTPPAHIAFRYFGARVDITLQSLEHGTDLTLISVDVPPDEWPDINSGWLNVLLPFKAWVDFGIDLRNHDPSRTWLQGFVDQ